QLARGCSRSSTAVPRKSSRKNTLPTGSASGFIFGRYIAHFSQKSMLCGTAKRIFQRQTAKSRMSVNSEDRGRNGPNQSPVPGFGEKCCSFPATPSHSFASAGGSLFTVMLGQVLA